MFRKQAKLRDQIQCRGGMNVIVNFWMWGGANIEMYTKISMGATY